jgi:hypothetical protein
MSLWGRNDQAVTANSTTTKASSNGAPLGLWARVKGAKTGTANVSHGANAHFGNTSAGARAREEVNLFNNVSSGAFVSGQAVGIFGVSATEMANNIANKSPEHPTHAGWNLRRAGTGPIINVFYTGVATNYNNTDLGVVTSPVAGGNGAFKYTTNSTGGALTFVITTPGFGFLAVNATPNVVIQNSTGGATITGSGATFTSTAGGRAGRIHYETIVAMKSLGAQTAPRGTPALVADSATDNTQLPGT